VNKKNIESLGLFSLVLFFIILDILVFIVFTTYFIYWLNNLEAYIEFAKIDPWYVYGESIGYEYSIFDCIFVYSVFLIIFFYINSKALLILIKKPKEKV